MLSLSLLKLRQEGATKERKKERGADEQVQFNCSKKEEKELAPTVSPSGTSVSPLRKLTVATLDASAVCVLYATSDKKKEGGPAW